MSMMVLALAALKQKIWPTMYCLTAGRDSRLLLGYVIATEGPGHTEPHHSCLQIFAIGAAQPNGAPVAVVPARLALDLVSAGSEHNRLPGDRSMRTSCEAGTHSLVLE